MDPPDLLSVELSTPRPTQHLGRLKSKSPASLPVPPRASAAQEQAALAPGQWGQGCRGTAVPWLQLAVGARREAVASAEVGIPGWPCWPARRSVPLSPPRTLRSCLSSLPLSLLSSPEPKPPRGLHAGQEPHLPPGSCARCSGTRAPPILPPHCFPLLLGLYCWLGPCSPPSLCLSPRCPPVWLSSLPCLARSVPSALRMAFLAGEPPPRPPQPAIFAQSKWVRSRSLGPCPRPLSPLIPPLLEGTAPWWAGGVVGGGGERAVCAVSFGC